MKRKSMTNFLLWQSRLSIFYKYWHSINLFYSRTYTRGVFRTQLNIYNKAFLWFLQRCPIADVLLGSKYASAYIYIRVSPIEIILHIILSILNIFPAKHLFLTKEEWNKVAINELKFLSVYFILAHKLVFSRFFYIRGNLGNVSSRSLTEEIRLF